MNSHFFGDTIMNTITNKRTLAMAAAALALVGGLMATPDAEARGRRGQATVQTQHGAVTGTGSVSRQRGSRTRDATVTGPNGRETSVHDQRTVNREEGTYSHDRQRTYANGDTRAVETDAQRTGEGQWSAERTVTGRNGETRTQTGDFTATRTENGRAVTGDIQTQNHGQIDYQRDVTHQDGARSVNSSATFEDGTSISRASTAACESAGNCASSGAITNRQGETTTWTQERTREGTDAALSRDVTFADGTTRAVDTARDGNGDGTGTVTRSATRRNGQTTQQTGTYEVTRPN